MYFCWERTEFCMVLTREIVWFRDETSFCWFKIRESVWRWLRWERKSILEIIVLSWETVLSLARPVIVERRGVNKFLGKRAREFIIMSILPICAERACILGVIFWKSGFVWSGFLVLWVWFRWRMISCPVWIRSLRSLQEVLMTIEVCWEQ